MFYGADYGQHSSSQINITSVGLRPIFGSFNRLKEQYEQRVKTIGVTVVVTPIGLCMLL
jgi:hypothetical protein